MGSERKKVMISITLITLLLMLSLAAVVPMGGDSIKAPSEMRLIGLAQVGMFVEDPPQIDSPREDVNNEADILPTLAISLVMACVVFGLAIPLKARKKREDGD